MIKYTKSISFNMIHVCIDKYDDYQIEGRAYNNTIESPIHFSDIHEIVLRFDDIFNKNGNPLSSSIKRSFTHTEEIGRYQNKPKTLCSYEVLEQYQGKIMDFDIVVKSRRQSTWQGSLFFDGEELAFMDILDMFKMIDQQIHKSLKS